LLPSNLAADTSRLPSGYGGLHETHDRVESHSASHIDSPIL
jgi:hypothetical protein